MFWIQGSQLCALFVMVAVRGISAERCSTPGVEGNDGSNMFRICSKNADGSLTFKQFPCGEGSYYSKQKKGCVMDSGEEDDQDDQDDSGNSEDPSTALGAPLLSSAQGHSGTYSRGSVSTSNRRLKPITPVPRSNYTLHGPCSGHGHFCENQYNLITCLRNQVSNIKPCKSCSMFKNECMDDSDEFELPQSGSIECTSIGLFPDPYFCNRFHLCSRNRRMSRMHSCDAGKYFNSVTESCQNPDMGTQAIDFNTFCPKFPECTHQEQVGTKEDDERFYFICNHKKDSLMLEKYIYKCLRNQRYGDECNDILH